MTRVSLGLAVSTLSSLGFVIAYVLDTGVQSLGLLATAALGGMGFALVSFARGLIPMEHETEIRQPVASTPEEEATVTTDLRRAAGDPGRRRLLGWLFGGSVGALVLALLSPLRSLAPRSTEALYDTAWNEGRRLITTEGRPVTVDTLPFGAAITVFPEGAQEAADSAVILARVEPHRLALPEGRASWAPEGYLAYSKICTHAGCAVGLFDPSSGLLTCPCHHSAFLALAGAVPITGPATRPLPQLPLGIDEEGVLVALGDFPRPVGPGFWGAPTA